jgi:hypothetical protein
MRIRRLGASAEAIAVLVQEHYRLKERQHKGPAGPAMRAGGLKIRGFPDGIRSNAAGPKPEPRRCIFCGNGKVTMRLLTRYAHRACMDRVNRARNQAWQRYERGEA